jgi:pyruvate formate lyase activating enzyme
MTFTGQTWSLDDLVREVLKDRDYYDAFGGGVTVSGGEPLSQYPFVRRFFQRLHEEGVHTALDTCALAPTVAFEAVLPHTDHVLFDIKLLDPEQHKAFTGHTNDLILRNLAYVAEFIRETNGAIAEGGGAVRGAAPMRLWIRTPLIPDATATPENIDAIGRYIHANLADVVERWELCAFNNACQQKYDKLGMAWIYEGSPLMDQPFIDHIEQVALTAGTPEETLVISGLVAKPEA